MAMKPKKMRGGGMIKKMRGGGMAGKKTVGMAAPGGKLPSGKKPIDTTKLGKLPPSRKVPTMVTKSPVGAPGTKTPVKGPKRAPTGRSGPNTAKTAMGKKANAVKKAGARRAGGGMPVGMSTGGKVGRKKK